MADRDEWIQFSPAEGPGAKLLAKHHGFDCTVVFAIDPDTGEIDPSCQTNIPGLHHLDSADLMVLFTRFRELPDEQMKHIVDYTNSGGPVMGLRTATHAFKYSRNPGSPYVKYSCDSEVFEGGYGRQVLGETWPIPPTPMPIPPFFLRA